MASLDCFIEWPKQHTKPEVKKLKNKPEKVVVEKDKDVEKWDIL